jgi:hypothetical protein
MVELVIFKVSDGFCGYVRDMVYICAFGDTVEDVTMELLATLEIYEFIQMELALTQLLNELEISRPNESD